MKRNNKILTFLIITLIAIIAILTINTITKNKVGELKEINYKEITKKLDNKEDFILIVSQTTCSHCASYKPKVAQIVEEYGINAYYIDYDKLSNTEEFLEKLNLNGATPMTLFYENGKEKSVLNRIEGDISSKFIKEKFKKMGFIVTIHS